jgi:hypothetical protein
MRTVTAVSTLAFIGASPDLPQAMDAALAR